jgi:hypothetical protein
MKRFFTIILLFCTCCLFAQNTLKPLQAEENPPAETIPETPVIPNENQSDFVYRANQKGDQYIKINLMVDLPIKPDMQHLIVGGAGTIGYTRFLNPFFSLGGDLSFGYNVTIGSNVFTFVPILFKATYQPAYRKFEFPVSLGVGFAFENYISRTYFGLIIKPEVAAYYRIVPEWSFGIHFGMFFMPQWYSNKEYNYLGIISDLGISGRYHF